MILRRIPDERYSEVLPEWRGCAVVLLGGGPSLSLEQVALVQAAHEQGLVKCIAVNDSYLWAPWADVHYAADSHWHLWHSNGIPKPKLKLTSAQVREAWASFKGQKCTVKNSGANVKDDRVHMLRNKGFPLHTHGISDDPRALCTGRNSGFQALNIAVLAKAQMHILLGYDARDGLAPGQTHWHGGHPHQFDPRMPEIIRRSFSLAENDLRTAGARVINCSPGSAINSFEKMDLQKALTILREAA